jgi:hypothetical protein
MFVTVSCLFVAFAVNTQAKSQYSWIPEDGDQRNVSVFCVLKVYCICFEALNVIQSHNNAAVENGL